MLRIVFLFILFVLISVLVGCSGAGDGSGNGSGTNISGGTCGNTITDLQGSWEYCSGTGDATRYTFNNSCVTVSFRTYANSDCTGPITFDVSQEYDFSLGSFVVTDGGQTAREINVGLTGAMQYDIYMINGATMYRGLPTATNNMSSPSTRPTGLNFTVPYDFVP